VSDRVLIPVPGLGVLALPVETYREALRRGAEIMGVKDDKPAMAGEPYEDAEALARAFKVPTSQVAQKMRTGEIPNVKVGRYRRAQRSVAAAALSGGSA